MQETVIKVGHPPDFVMTSAKREYFHIATVSLVNSKGICLDTRKISVRSFKTLTDSIKSFVNPRFQTRMENLGIYRSVHKFRNT